MGIQEANSLLVPMLFSFIFYVCAAKAKTGCVEPKWAQQSVPPNGWRLHVEDFVGLLNTLELHDSSNKKWMVIIVKHKMLEGFVCLFYYDGYIDQISRKHVTNWNTLDIKGKHCYKMAWLADEKYDGEIIKPK